MPERDADLLIEDMLTAIRKIERYTSGMKEELFRQGETTVDAAGGRGARRRRMGRWLPALLLAAVVVVYALPALVVPPSLGLDAAWGFLTWRSMEHGAGYNTWLQPDPADISRDRGIFQNLWSPGQYMVPAVFMKMGLPLGRALTATVTLCSALGLAGWFFLYRRLGFTHGLAGASCALIAANRFFAYPFGTYNGGEILLFGGFPWIAALLVAQPDLPWRSLPGVVLAFLAGTFLKLSFMVGAVALLVSGFLYQLASGRRGQQLLAWALRAATAGGLAYALVWLAHLSRYAMPLALSFSPSLWGMVFPFVGPLLSAFSGDDLLNRLLFFPSAPVLDFDTAFAPLLLPLVPLAVYLGVRLYRSAPTRAYAMTVAGFSLSYALAFLVFFAAGEGISLEARHFRPAGLILLPGYLLLAQRSRSAAGRALSWALLAAIALYGTSAYWVRLRERAQTLYTGLGGFAHRVGTATAQTLLRKIDGQWPPGNNLIYVATAEEALDLNRSRTLVMPRGEPIYRGRVDALLVALPQSEVVDGRAYAILRSFAAYRRWRSIACGGYLFFFPEEPDGRAPPLR